MDAGDRADAASADEQRPEWGAQALLHEYRTLRHDLEKFAPTDMQRDRIREIEQEWERLRASMPDLPPLEPAPLDPHA